MNALLSIAGVLSYRDRGKCFHSRRIHERRDLDRCRFGILCSNGLALYRQSFCFSRNAAFFAHCDSILIRFSGSKSMSLNVVSERSL